ncbi:hypothetical protein T07_13205 [Trichinella nelsoni]|uniref:Uncharacterized protein n=1 Tax=Trichinella nelsoni TaxID=6336 RepID=A0A0V0S4D1_9BILA|nr:hypothetical protein T07_13205 [Trichinella nelsoni]
MDRHGLVNADRSEHLVRGFGRANAHHSNLSVEGESVLVVVQFEYSVLRNFRQVIFNFVIMKFNNKLIHYNGMKE